MRYEHRKTDYSASVIARRLWFRAASRSLLCRQQCLADASIGRGLYGDDRPRLYACASTAAMAMLSAWRRAAAENRAASGEELPTGSIEELVWDQLRSCFDPEIPVNIVDLGFDLRLRRRSLCRTADIKPSSVLP